MSKEEKKPGKNTSMLLTGLSVKCRWMNKWNKDLNRDLGFLIISLCVLRKSLDPEQYFSKKQVEKSSRDSWPLHLCIRAPEMAACGLLTASKAFICFQQRSFIFSPCFLMVAAVEHNGCCSLD